jgi:hypothetical protein
LRPCKGCPPCLVWASLWAWTRTARCSCVSKQQEATPDPPPVRLRRWASLFADELAEVHHLAKRPLLSDIELRQAHYLAGRLLATVTDLPLKDVDSFEL